MISWIIIIILGILAATVLKISHMKHRLTLLLLILFALFLTATMGVVADTMWGDPTKGLSAYLSNKNTLVGGWFDEIHSMHHSGSPLDYQGFKMGGGNHGNSTSPIG